MEKRKFKEGEANHVYQRTISGFNIFYDVEDYIVYYTIFSVLAVRYDLIVYGLCLMIDHIHMLVSIPPKLAVSKFMGILKGKSSLIIFQRWSNLKYKFGQRSFWCRGYYVDTVGKNEKKIAEYVRNQLQEDMMYDQISIKEYLDPFKDKNK